MPLKRTFYVSGFNFRVSRGRKIDCERRDALKIGPIKRLEAAERTQALPPRTQPRQHSNQTLITRLRVSCCGVLRYGGRGSRVGLGWVGLSWVGLGWVGLGWVGLGWVGLGWVGLGWVELG